MHCGPLELSKEVDGVEKSPPLKKKNRPCQRLDTLRHRRPYESSMSSVMQIGLC